METKRTTAKASKVESKAQQMENGVVGSMSKNFMVSVEKAMMKGGVKAAIKEIESIALTENPEVICFYSQLLLNGEVIKDEFDKGWELLMYSAAHGNINAIVDVAAMAIMQAETTEGQKIAFNWIHEAAILGQPECEMILSSFYAAGYGCKRNVKLAHMWKQKAILDNYNQKKALVILGIDDNDI